MCDEKCVWKNQFFLFGFLIVSSFLLYIYYDADLNSYFSGRGQYLASKIVHHIWGKKHSQTDHHHNYSEHVTTNNIIHHEFDQNNLLSSTSSLKPFFEPNDNNNNNNSNLISSKYLKNFQVYDTDLIFPGKEKIIVFYTKIYGQVGGWMSDKFSRDGIFYRFNDGGYDCPHKCAFTHQKNFSSIADAIIFSILDSLYHSDQPPMPKERPWNQFWIGQTWETGLNHVRYTSRSVMDSVFNWTASYRQDSDVPMVYGYFEKIVDPKNYTQPDLTGSKQLAVALASNCQSYSRREDLIRFMQKFIPVQVYGQCGQPCPNDTDCRQYLAQRFKFMLSFENSLCEDYVTEKFFMALEHNMVPVVYGLANYQKIAPPGSYINVLDFPSIQALTDYLQFLDKNDKEYAKYFTWKRTHRVRFDRDRDLCGLCQKLWAPRGNPRKIYHSFSKWWESKQPHPHFLENDFSNKKSMEENLMGFHPRFRQTIVNRDKACFSGRILMKEWTKNDK